MHFFLSDSSPSEVQQAITETDRELARNRVQFVQVRDGLHEFQDEVDVLKNQLSAAAHESVAESGPLPEEERL